MKISVANEPYSEDTYKAVCLSKDQGNGGWDSKEEAGKYLGQDEGTWKSINSMLRMNLIYLCKGETLWQGRHSILPAVWKTKGR